LAKNANANLDGAYFGHSALAMMTLSLLVCVLVSGTIACGWWWVHVFNLETAWEAEFRRETCSVTRPDMALPCSAVLSCPSGTFDWTFIGDRCWTDIDYITVTVGPHADGVTYVDRDDFESSGEVGRAVWPGAATALLLVGYCCAFLIVHRRSGYVPVRA